MDLRYSGDLRKDKYLAMLRLNARPILKRAGFHVDLWVMLLVIGGVILLLSAITLYQAGSSAATSFPWYLLEAIAGLSLISLAVKLRGLPVKFWEENKKSIFHIQGQLSDEIIELFTPNSQVKVSWSELVGYGEYKGLIVLYKTSVFFLPFVERFFEEPEDWLAFREFVRTHIPMTHRVNQLERSSTRSKGVYLLLAISVIIMMIYYLFRGG